MSENENRSSYVIEVRNLEVVLGEKRLINDLNLNIFKNEILGVIGASGSGKTVLMRTLIGLLPKNRGKIFFFGEDLDLCDKETLQRLNRKRGILFQHGALFSSLTVKENVELPMQEFLNATPRLIDEMVMFKIESVGLPPDAAFKHPGELSGGMIKRAALARALALEPEIVFLDEPTSGLDPISSQEFDELILSLKKSSRLTVFMITHDLGSLYTACDRVAVIEKGKIIMAGDIEDVMESSHPWLKRYFNAERAVRGGTEKRIAKRKDA